MYQNEYIWGKGLKQPVQGLALYCMTNLLDFSKYPVKAVADKFCKAPKDCSVLNGRKDHGRKRNAHYQHFCPHNVFKCILFQGQ